MKSRIKPPAFCTPAISRVCSILFALTSFLEPVVLAAVTLFVGLVWVFFEVAEEVLEGDTQTMDMFVLKAMRNRDDPLAPWGPLWFQEMMRDISGLGGVVILAIVTVGAALYLLMTRKRFQALYLLATVLVGTMLSNVLKYIYDRPRPDIFPHGSYVYTNSFPSGHSMMSAIVYLCVGMLLARAQDARNLKIYFLGLSIFLTVIVGISRVYLGVHWPTDVLAGWLAGAICAMTAWLIEWCWPGRRASLAAGAIIKSKNG